MVSYHCLEYRGLLPVVGRMPGMPFCMPVGSCMCAVHTSALLTLLLVLGHCRRAICASVGCCMCADHTSALSNLLLALGVCGCTSCAPAGCCMRTDYASALPSFWGISGNEWDGGRGADQGFTPYLHPPLPLFPGLSLGVLAAPSLSLV